MNKAFYYEYLNQGDLDLARNLASELSSDLRLPVYPALGLSNGSVCRVGIYFEADIDCEEREKELEQLVSKKMTGRISTGIPRPAAESYNAYPLTIYNMRIEDVGDTWYKLNQTSKANIDCKALFSSFLYEKNGNVEVGGTFKMSGEGTQSLLVNEARKAYVYKLHKEFPNSKVHFEHPRYNW
ncbi:MAG: hypothetical protein LBR70_05440 [Lactobacillaceae bacterium]|jgi:hypothetical protein|nr:hypothetical protein [Lactobacillaceae bacterium]